MAKNEEKVMPIARLRCGAVSVSIWENKGKKDGKEYNIKSVTMQRSYKDEKGEWKNSESFSGSDILVLSRLLVIAHEKFNINAEDAE